MINRVPPDDLKGFRYRGWLTAGGAINKKGEEDEKIYGDD